MQKLLQKNRPKTNNTLIYNEFFISHEQPKIENVKNNKNNVNNPSVSTHEDQAYVVIGPTNVRKTYYMLKVLEKIGNRRPIHIITRSSTQHSIYKTSNEIKPMDK